MIFPDGTAAVEELGAGAVSVGKDLLSLLKRPTVYALATISFDDVEVISAWKTSAMYWLP